LTIVPLGIYPEGHSGSWRNSENIEMSVPETAAAKAVLTIRDFTYQYSIGKSKLFDLWAKGEGPRRFRLGKRVLITREAAQEFIRAREAQS
jgi:hypothetical protein